MKTKNFFYAILVMAFSLYSCEKDETIIPEEPSIPVIVKDTIYVDSIASAYDATKNLFYQFSNFSNYTQEVTSENLESSLSEVTKGWKTPFYNIENEESYSFELTIVQNPQYDLNGNLTSDGFVILKIDKIDLMIDTIKIRWTEIVNKSNAIYKVSWVKDSIFINDNALNYEYKFVSSLYYKKNGTSLDILTTSALDENGMNPYILNISFSNLLRNSYLDCSIKFENNYLPEELQDLAGNEITAKFFSKNYLSDLFHQEITNNEFKVSSAVMALTNEKYIKKIF